MIEANGFVATGRTVNYAFWLLSKLLNVDVKLLKLVVMNRKNYRTIFVKKSGHGKKKRQLDIPRDSLKTIQGLLLKKLFSRINLSLFPEWNMLTGYVRGKSNLDNVTPHINGKYFIQIDLQDAFPSVSNEMVRKALSVLFDPLTVKRLFIQPKTEWFVKKFFAELGEYRNSSSHQDDEQEGEDEIPFDDENTPRNTLWAMREIILWLTMFNNKLPQGAPTSPFLFNLVVVDCQLPTIIQRTVKSFFCLQNLPKTEDRFSITFYADNITVSSEKLRLSVAVSNSIISAIESQTPFRVNREKVHCASIECGSPKITGLSIGRRENALVTVSRDLQRRARGLLHSAINNPDLRDIALGTASYLTNVYGSKEALPKQIRLSYEALLAQIAEE